MDTTARPALRLRCPAPWGRRLFLGILAVAVIAGGWIALGWEAAVFAAFWLAVIGTLGWAVAEALSMWRRNILLADDEGCTFRSDWPAPFGREPLRFRWAEVIGIKAEENLRSRLLPDGLPALAIHLDRDPAQCPEMRGQADVVRLPGALWSDPRFLELLRRKLSDEQIHPGALRPPRGVSPKRAILVGTALFLLAAWMALLALTPRLQWEPLLWFAVPQVFAASVLGAVLVVLTGTAWPSVFVAGLMELCGILFIAHFVVAEGGGRISWLPAWMAALAGLLTAMSIIVLFRRTPPRWRHAAAVFGLGLIGFGLGPLSLGRMQDWQVHCDAPASTTMSNPWLPDGSAFVLVNPRFPLWTRLTDPQVRRFHADSAEDTALVRFGASGRPTARTDVYDCRLLQSPVVGLGGALCGGIEGKYRYFHLFFVPHEAERRIRRFRDGDIVNDSLRASPGRLRATFAERLTPQGDSLHVEMDLTSGEVRDVTLPPVLGKDVFLQPLNGGAWLAATLTVDAAASAGRLPPYGDLGLLKLWYWDEPGRTAPTMIHSAKGVEVGYWSLRPWDGQSIVLVDASPGTGGSFNVDLSVTPPKVVRYQRPTVLPPLPRFYLASAPSWRPWRGARMRTLLADGASGPLRAIDGGNTSGLTQAVHASSSGKRFLIVGQHDRRILGLFRREADGRHLEWGRLFRPEILSDPRGTVSYMDLDAPGR